MVNYDFLPTFLDWAGGNPGNLKNIDGVSLAAYMTGREPDESFLNRNLYFHYPHYRTTMPHSAVMSGSRKVMHLYERPEVPMLFDLSRDIGEVHNIARLHVQEHQKLYDEMMAYFVKVGARMPRRNPDLDLKVYKRAKEYAQRVLWEPFKDRRPLEEDEK